MNYKVITLSLTAIGVVVFGGYVFYKTIWVNNIAGESALAVNTTQGSANVFVNDKLLGTTPFYSNAIKAGEVNISVRNDDRNFNIDLNISPKTETVINRELGPNRDFTAGDTVWVEKGTGEESLSVLSDPVGALVKIDGEVKGESPISVNNVSAGEHDLEVSKDGFETRTLRVDVVDGYKLNVDTKLFPKPIGKPLKELDISTPVVFIYPLHLEDVIVTSTVKMHIQAIQYFLSTRQSYLPENKSQSLSFDYYITEDGSLYNDEGEGAEPEVKDGQVVNIAYFGNGEKLTDKALEMVNVIAGNVTIEGDTEPDKAITNNTTSGEGVLILETGTGWLRVRGGPGLGFDEVAKVDVGKVYNVLDDQGEWIKIQVSDGVEGWVSGTYVEAT